MSLTPEEKKRRRKERKLKKEVVPEESQIKTSLSFVNKNGKTQLLSSVVSPDEIWEYKVRRKREGKMSEKIKHVLSYEAVKRIAKEAGISQIGLEIFDHPRLENKMNTYLNVIFGCQNCQHGGFLDEKGNAIFQKLGEASDENTSSITKLYKGTIAEKRGFVRGVIEHLSLPDMYGEEEFNEKDEESDGTGLKQSELKELADSGIINSILNARTLDELQTVGESLKERITSFSEKQVDYLKRLYAGRRTSLSPKEF